jgi:catechol 2,3-dioxygenase-like lactoylglutathione lyase family enzyme
MDEGGLVLTLMRAGWPPYRGQPGNEEVQVKYPGNFHIGFAQDSEERVNEIYRRLKEDGFDVEPPQRSHAWTFYVNAPGGFMVEVLANDSTHS